MDRSIDDWRQKIDEIDEHLVSLFNERAKAALEIGHLKKARGLDVYHPEREREIMTRLRTMNAGPLSGDAVERIFSSMIEECRRLEHDISGSQL